MAPPLAAVLPVIDEIEQADPLGSLRIGQVRRGVKFFVRHSPESEIVIRAGFDGFTGIQTVAQLQINSRIGQKGFDFRKVGILFGKIMIGDIDDDPPRPPPSPSRPPDIVEHRQKTRYPHAQISVPAIPTGTVEQFPDSPDKIRHDGTPLFERGFLHPKKTGMALKTSS